MQQQESTSPYRHSYQTTVSHRQRQLPPLQDIIKAESKASPDRKLKSEDDWDFSPGYLDCSASSTPLIASSPNHSIGTLIPSLSHTFDELNFCTGDTMLSGSNGWGTAMQYSAASGVYGVNSAASQTYYGRPTLSIGRSQQNLPSLTDMNLPNRTPSYSSRPSQVPREYADSDYYSPSATDPLDISYPKDSQQGYNSSFGVVTAPRTSYPIAGYDNWSPVSEGYCYPNGHSWPPTMQCSSSGYGGSDTASLHSPRRRRGNLPKEVTEILRAWFQEHLDHPYPTEVDKQMLIAKTQLSLSQISNWFINARRRHWPQMKQNRDHVYKLPTRTYC